MVRSVFSNSEQFEPYRNPERIPASLFSSFLFMHVKILPLGDSTQVFGSIYFPTKFRYISGFGV
ncbi:hypothetical protein Hanom_Chr04g00357481 [Helianthus anomalus]